MLDMLGRMLGERISIEIELDDGLWPVFADISQLENAVINLAINARDAMPDGGRLHLRTCNLPAAMERAADAGASDCAALIVTDSGTGMSADTVARAFEPFFTTKGVGRGTGLGLSQVYGYVKQTGGSVEIRSREGVGTEVELRLPRYLGAVAPATAAAGGEQVPHGNAAEIILLVEDEQQVRHMATDALRELGYTVVSVGSGSQALAQIDTLPRLDLLLTDVMMPDMLGTAVAAQARTRRPALRTLYMSGHTQGELLEDGRLGDGVLLLQKPFTVEQLARKVRDVMTEHHPSESPPAGVA